MATGIKCSNGHDQPQAGSRFCIYCGVALAASPQAAAGAPPPQAYAGTPNFAVQGNPQAPASQRPLISVILAGVGLICCGPLTGIPAALVGWLELDAIKNGKSSPDGKMMAQIGFLGGIGVTIIHGILWILYILFGMFASMNP